MVDNQEQSNRTSIEEPEIPEDLKKKKQELEEKTGKKYRYRVPKKDLPSVQYLLAHGAPESQGRTKTWRELIAFPLVLLIVFVISLIIFKNAPHHLSRRHGQKFTLPKLVYRRSHVVKQQNEEKAHPAEL